MRLIEICACHGKARFETSSEAERIARRSRRGKYRSARRVYRCPVCRGFHVGTTTRAFE